jgi:hypothetical protein
MEEKLIHDDYQTCEWSFGFVFDRLADSVAGAGRNERGATASDAIVPWN